jgi:hypothetical protein
LLASDAEVLEQAFRSKVAALAEIGLMAWFIRAIPKSPEAVQALDMRAGITVNVMPDDRCRLEAIVANHNAPQKHVWRAKHHLATADGCDTAEVMRRSGKSKPVVWRWLARFMAEGVAGLTRDKTRKPGKPPLPPATVPPWEGHYRGRKMASSTSFCPKAEALNQLRVADSALLRIGNVENLGLDRSG